MAYTQHLCAKYSSEQIRRNGRSGERAKYLCKACEHQRYFQPASAQKARKYAQVDQLLLERHSLPSIVRLACVARNTIVTRVKNALQPTPAAAEKSAKKIRRR
jgi:transposase-like protein